MKKIILEFKTKKGEKAYYKVEEEGKAQSYLDRKIGRAVARESILSKEPLTIELKIKVKRLAIKVGLDNQIIQGLKKHGAIKGVDYDMEVKF